MPIHPTFNFVPRSWPKRRHAPPNHHRPTTMLDKHVEVRHVVHLQSNTIIDNLSLTYLSLSHH